VFCIRYRSIIGTCIDYDSDKDSDRIYNVEVVVIIVIDERYDNSLKRTEIPK
jgi:hypothetical protein